MATGNRDSDVYREIMRGAGSVQETEQERLAQQGEAYPRLTTWTLDALGIGTGTTVLELGCGDGLLLAAAAEHGDERNAGYYVRFPALVGTVGRKADGGG